MASNLESRLPRATFDVLQKYGLKTPEQVIVTSDYELLRCGPWTLEDISRIKDVAADLLLPSGFTNVYDVKINAERLGKLSTGCPLIDERLLRGGFRKRTVIEINGESGCGKTQIALQAATRAWKEGAVYICTEDAFPSKRLQQMFSTMKSQDSFDSSKCGEKIFVLHVAEIEELKNCINVQLPCLLESVKGISLVILDSIAAPFRGEHQDASEMVERTSFLKEIGMKLLEIAKDHNLAVLCINQVSAALDSDTSSDTVPCLGLTWSKMVTSRLQLKKTQLFCQPSELPAASLRQPTTDGSVTAPSIDPTLLSIKEMSVEYSPESPTDVTVKYVITQNGVFGLDIA